MAGEAVTSRQRLWRVIEIGITGAVVIAVGWQFASLIRSPELWSQPLQFQSGWLTLSAVLYVLGLATSAVYWHLILHRLGQRPPGLLATLRAYYVGQLGRYVPGKVVGVLWRSRLLRGPTVHGGVAALTVVYESLTTLAAALLLGGVVLGVDEFNEGHVSWKTWGMLALVGIPLIPGVFNYLLDRATRRWREDPSTPLPAVRGRTLLFGLAITTFGWLLQGGSLLALTEAVFPGNVLWTLGALLHYAAYVGVAFAVGFLVIAVPGGLGVREYFLQRFLSKEFGPILGASAAPTAAMLALLLRLVWTVVDVAAAGVCWVLPKVLDRVPEPVDAASSELRVAS